MSDTPPDTVVTMSHDARRNSWSVWCQPITEGTLLGWTWGDDARPSDGALLVLEEIEKNCMADLDAGPDGIPVVTFGLFEFEHNLHASLFDLIDKVIEGRVNSIEPDKGRFTGEERDEALRLAQGLERCAAMLRERL